MEPIQDGIWAQAVGEVLLKAAKNQSWKEEVDTRAVRLLQEIQEALDDDNLDDPDCFHRIEELLTVWNNAGLRSNRHACLG